MKKKQLHDPNLPMAHRLLAGIMYKEYVIRLSV